MAGLTRMHPLQRHWYSVAELRLMEEKDREYLAVLKEAVINTIVAPKQIKNHMGKRSWRALKQFNQAIEKKQTMNAERAAVELGLSAEVLVGIKVLLER